MKPEHMTPNEMAEYLDWAGHDFAALPVATRGGYWADADLSRINAPATMWNSAYCRDANFAGAALVGADFCSAYLGGASFEEADLRGACFDLAAVTGARFHGAQLPAIDAFTRTFVGSGDPKRIARVTGLPLAYVLHAQATSLPIVERCRAERTQSIYQPVDPGYEIA